MKATDVRRGGSYVTKLEGRERDVRVTKLVTWATVRGRYVGRWRGVVVATGEQAVRLRLLTEEQARRAFPQSDAGVLR